jgi:hypothetical protein
MKPCLFLLLLLLLLLLAACDSASDPYAMRSAADGMIAATQSARQERAQAATLQAARTQDAFDATRQALAFEQTAVVVTRDAAVSTEIARSTQGAHARETQSAAFFAQQTNVAWLATSTSAAIAVLQSQAEATRTAQTAAMWQGTVRISIAGLLIVLALSALLGYQLAHDYFKARIKAGDRLASIIETRVGPVYINSLPDGRYEVRLITDRLPLRLEALSQARQAVHVSPAEIVAESPMSSASTEALWLVRKSIALNGEDSNLILGHREAGLSATAWTRIIGWFKSAGVARTVEGGGTYVERGDLGGLLYALEVGEVRLKDDTRTSY